MTIISLVIITSLRARDFQRDGNYMKHVYIFLSSIQTHVISRQIRQYFLIQFFFLNLPRICIRISYIVIFWNIKKNTRCRIITNGAFQHLPVSQLYGIFRLVSLRLVPWHRDFYSATTHKHDLAIKSSTLWEKGRAFDTWYEWFAFNYTSGKERAIDKVESARCDDNNRSFASARGSAFYAIMSFYGERRMSFRKSQCRDVKT